MGEFSEIFILRVIHLLVSLRFSLALSATLFLSCTLHFQLIFEFIVDL